MSAREQTAWDDPPVLRTHRVPVTDRQRVPARKGAGHQAGIHPEDEPYYTTGQLAKRARADVELYEPPRMPTVVRKYKPPVTQVAEEVPVRRLLPAHFLLTVFGIFLLVIVLALFLTMYVFPALRGWNDDRTYGYPRTLHVRANVGHGTAAAPYSDFVAENVRGRIYVVEIGEGSTAPTLIHAYYIIQLTGESNDRVAITAITFSDMNGDGKLDMFVTLENGSTFVFYNTGSSFSQQNPQK
jgi:hypothetical protein